ncbi:MAG: SPOR domain-containing protein [Cocleimonas sp.]
MNSTALTMMLLALVISLLSGCSLLKSKQNNTENTTVIDQLSIPPSLKTPVTIAPAKKISRAPRQTNKDFFIVVGTYPIQEQALDMFVRLSSIGLANAAMESRQTKQGQTVHMVRLGPYNNQDDIDKTKDTLTNDGLSQFKVVVN